jgi:hypothetical protein
VIPISETIISTDRSILFKDLAKSLGPVGSVHAQKKRQNKEKKLTNRKKTKQKRKEG